MMSDFVYKPPQSELEALRRFTEEILHEALRADSWYKARAQGGQQVGVASLPPSVVRLITQSARNNGLDLDYSKPAVELVWTLPV